MTAYTLQMLAQTRSQVFQCRQQIATFEAQQHCQLLQQINENDITTSSINISTNFI